MAEQRTLVTGALGCLGAWTLKALLDLGEEPVGFDLGSDDARVRLVLSEEERARVTLVEGDVTDGATVGAALDEHGITNVVHLARRQGIDVSARSVGRGGRGHWRWSPQGGDAFTRTSGRHVITRREKAAPGFEAVHV